MSSENPYEMWGQKVGSCWSYDRNKIAQQAEMLGRRVRKNFRHRNRQFTKEQVECFRLYDQDIPEIRATVDWYNGSIVMGEFVREQTTGNNWLGAMAGGVREFLKVPNSSIFLRQRRTQPSQGRRYHKQAEHGRTQVVREGLFQFEVNLSDYLDTGLFSDHRLTRQLLSSMSLGKKVLNLFSYTGSFSVAAAVGGAEQITSVDSSQKYLAWSERNFRLNKVDPTKFHFVCQDVKTFVANTLEGGWDIVVLDPPSFSDRHGQWRVQSHHRALVAQVMKILRPGGILLFSTNYHNFRPDLAGLAFSVEEITSRVVPLDFRRRRPYRCFMMRK